MSQAHKTNRMNATIKIGTRIRCTEDGMVGKIVWANATSVKIQWEDGEAVTWKRADLTKKPIALVDEDAEAMVDDAPTPMEPSAKVQPTVEPTDVKPMAARKPKVERTPKAKKTSALDAAANVLAEMGTPMNCKELIEAMATKGYWSSPNGKTPSQTLYAAILREMKVKGNDARFAKVDKGRFTLTRS